MERVYEAEEKCCGCGLCMAVCPNKAIEMKADTKGFYYPHIDKKKCINCGICKKTCLKIGKAYTERKHTYAIKNKSLAERKSSSSGGFFIELAKYVINNDGIVYGVAFDKLFKVKHILAEDKATLENIKGSKYVQSSAFERFSEIKENLDKGKIVLFSGTPCQISGLGKYLKNEYNNLLTCENICHGVGSPKIFEEYIKDKKYDVLAEKISFRYKNTNGDHNLSIDLKNGKKIIKLPYNDEYYKMFTDDLCIRPSCFECQFANLERRADFTIGDFWGVENVIPNFKDNNGVSIVILNSEKSKVIFERIKNNFILKEVELKNSLQPNLEQPTIKPNNYDEYWSDYIARGYRYIAKKYGRLSRIDSLKRKTRRILRKIKYG